MPFVLSAEETFTESVARLAAQRLDRVLAALSQAGDDSPSDEAVHTSRRDLKKLRALLRLARAALNPQVFKQENLSLRDAGRALAPVRDAQVLVRAFDALKPRLYGRIAPETLESVHRRLEDGVAASAAGLREGDRLRGAVATLTATRERIDAWEWKPQPPHGRAAGKGLRTVYRSGRSAMVRALDSAAEGDFHEWRKQVKYLGAQVRLLRRVWPRAPKRLQRRLDELGEILGDEHDFSVLAATLGANAEERESPHDLETIAGEIAERRRELQERALRLGHRVYRKKPCRFVKRISG